MIVHFVFALFSILMIYAAFSDLTSYTLPNFISLILIAGALILYAVIQPPLEVILWHLGVAAIVFIIGFILFMTGIFGGGDVKVIAALGLWIGPANILGFFTYMAIFGGLIAVALLIFRRAPLPDRYLKNKAISGLHDKNEGIPYGVAIAIAALIEFPKTYIYSALSAF